MVDPNRVIELTLNKQFGSFLQAVYTQHPLPHDCNVINTPIIALDPGETTGVAEYDGDVTIRVYQKMTKDIGQSYDWLQEKLSSGWTDSPGFSIPWKPVHLRYEDYRVYEWKAQDHAWSPVHTIQWIGAIQVASHVSGVPSSCIMASHAKAFWTDAKLDLFNLNPRGLRHGRDALRHLLYYLCFPTTT